MPNGLKEVAFLVANQEDSVVYRRWLNVIIVKALLAGERVQRIGRKL